MYVTTELKAFLDCGTRCKNIFSFTELFETSFPIPVDNGPHRERPVDALAQMQHTAFV